MSSNESRSTQSPTEQSPTELRVLADLTEQLRATSSRKTKTELVADVLRRLDPDEIEPAIGFLLAAPRQGAIGVGWATVAATTATATTNHVGGGVSIADLDELVDRLAAITGEGSVDGRVATLSTFLASCDTPTANYVRRVLSGDARQGALSGVVTEAVAKAAGVKAAVVRRAVMLQGDLGQAATVALVEGHDGLSAIDLTVHRPIQPMLASTAQNVADAVSSLGQSSVEWKLDGARIQVHLTRNSKGSGSADIAVYTRNLNNVTGRLPAVAQVVEKLDCRSAVLDGEVLGFFGDDDRPQAFQDTMSTFGTAATDDESASGLRPYFFDLMFLDGTSLIDHPLSERLELLDNLLSRSQVESAAIPRLMTADATAAEKHFAAAVKAGHEGVMIKAAGGAYEAGRRGKSWLKIKPVHTLDLVVLGAEWGHGRRQGWLSNLHLGARDPTTDKFVMVGKTFKGLTDELLKWQTERFQQLKRSEDDQTGRHVVMIKPELVVEIAVDGAQTSTRYPGGVALRFARVRGYRDDKSPAEADTLDAVRALL